MFSFVCTWNRCTLAHITNIIIHKYELNASDQQHPASHDENEAMINQQWVTRLEQYIQTSLNLIIDFCTLVVAVKCYRQEKMTKTNLIWYYLLSNLRCENIIYHFLYLKIECITYLRHLHLYSFFLERSDDFCSWAAIQFPADGMKIGYFITKPTSQEVRGKLNAFSKPMGALPGKNQY